MQLDSPATSLTLLSQLRQPVPPDDAWERFARLYTELLRSWARRQGLQEADADDLTNDILMNLKELLPKYKPVAGVKFRAWLSTVTANRCHDFRRRAATGALPGPDGLSGIGAVPPTEFEEVEYRKALVASGLKAIKGEFEGPTWAAFEMVMIQNRPTAEVATALGMTKNAVYIAKSRVLTRLRAVVEEFLD